ncbi:MAG TPA: YggS family pyridoxal phosphate-dependent enzyme [Ktedonobacteraceae bacterium]|nr:YggS family pyridoxal phosphate-dependent enzyme [Ktedonobacteraceae bacterium]
MLDNQPISDQERITANLVAVRANIEGAARRVGRHPEDITLIAVSKTKPIELVKMAYNAGVTHFGENRVQEALPKIAEFRPADLRWHMIGHLQSNKARKVAGSFDYVQSVDSLHLAQALNRYVEEENTQRLPILLEVNVSGEQSKEGIAATATVALARQIVALPHLDVQGLMTVAPQVEDTEEARPVFRALRQLLERLRDEVPAGSWRHLSMGMTDDYTIAIEEGATIVRIGRAIFGARVYKGDQQ